MRSRWRHQFICLDVWYVDTDTLRLKDCIMMNGAAESSGGAVHLKSSIYTFGTYLEFSSNFLRNFWSFSQKLMVEDISTIIAPAQEVLFISKVTYRIWTSTTLFLDKTTLPAVVQFISNHSLLSPFKVSPMTNHDVIKIKIDENSDNTFYNNSATTTGGSVQFTGANSVQLTGCHFDTNRAGVSGASLYVENTLSPVSFPLYT